MVRMPYVKGCLVAPHCNLTECTFRQSSLGEDLIMVSKAGDVKEVTRLIQAHPGSSILETVDGRVRVHPLF